MSQDLKHIEVHGAGGIDQSEKPRPNTVADSMNVVTNNGRWESMPGMKVVCSDSGWIKANYVCTLLTEFMPDSSYERSQGYVLLVGTVRLESDVAGQMFEINEFDDTVQFLSFGDAYGGSDVANGTVSLRWSAVDGLWRYTDGGATKYAPVKVMTNEYDKPVIYVQTSVRGASLCGELVLLDSIDGGDSSLSYLSDAPDVDFFCGFKERLFGFKGNTVYFTGPDSSLAFVVNVWPASYNFDVGANSEKITAAVEWQGNLVIFKERRMWIVSGDGVGGQWQVSQIEGEHGAMNHSCAKNVNGVVYFANKSGLYTWAGDRVRNISHPRVKRIWDEMRFSDPRFAPQVEYDVEGDRVIFNAPRETQVVTNNFARTGIIYNLGTDTFDSMGYVGNSMLSRDGTSARDCFTPSRIANLERYGAHPGLYGLLTGATSSFAHGVYKVFGGNHHHGFTGAQTVVTSAVKWFILTHRYFKQDGMSKLLRRIMISAKKTGDWKIGILPIVNDDNLAEAIRKKAADKWNYLADYISGGTFEVNGTSNFQTADDGPVDVFDSLTNMSQAKGQLMASAGLSASGASDRIKFSTYASQFMVTDDVKNGAMLVIPEGANPTVYFDMSGEHEFDKAGSTFDDAIADRLKHERMTKSVNLEGESFSLWISNMTYGKTGDPDELPLVNADINGWGLWVRPRNVWRP